MIIKKCAICEKEFIFKINGNKYTCSNACRGVWQTKTKETKKCMRPECLETFLVGGRSGNKSKKFCSRSCSGQIINLGRFKPKKLCAECKAPLENRARKYCSYTCQYSLNSRSKYIKTIHYNIAEIRTANDRPAGLALSDLPIDKISHDSRKMRIVLEQNHKCNRCGLDEWLGKPMTLELEHKDGDRYNNIRENLECLCPNCHSYTPTWRGRNARKKVTDEDMKEAILNTTSLSKALISLNMAAKGGNYKRISKMAAMITKDNDSVI